MNRCACCWKNEALQHQAFQASEKKDQRERMHSSRVEEGRMMNPGVVAREARRLFANSATAEEMVKGPFTNASMGRETAASHHCGFHGAVHHGVYPFKDFPQADLAHHPERVYSPQTPQTDDCSHFLQRAADSCSPGLSSSVFNQSRDSEQRRSTRFMTPDGLHECGTPANRVALYKWYLLRPRGGHKSEVAVGGLLALGTGCNQRIETAAIAHRLEKCRLLTKDGLDILLLGLIDDSTTVSNGFSIEIMHSFLSGFPYIWNHLVADECPDGGGLTKHGPSVSCDLSGGGGLSQQSFEAVSEEKKGTPQKCDGKGASFSCNTSTENVDCPEEGIATMGKETSVAADQAEGSELAMDDQREMPCVALKEQVIGANQLSQDTNLHKIDTVEKSKQALMKPSFSDSTTLSTDHEKHLGVDGEGVDCSSSDPGTPTTLQLEAEVGNQELNVLGNECNVNDRPRVVTHEEHLCEDETLKVAHETACPGMDLEQYTEEESTLSEPMHSAMRSRHQVLDGKQNTNSSASNSKDSLLKTRSVKPSTACPEKEEIKHYYLRSRRKSGPSSVKDDRYTCKSFNTEATKEGNANTSSLAKKGAVLEKVAVGEFKEVFVDVQIGQEGKIKDAALSPKEKVYAKKSRDVKESPMDKESQKHGVASYVTPNVSVAKIQVAQVTPCETGIKQDNLPLPVDARDKETATTTKAKVRRKFPSAVRMVKSENKLANRTKMVRFSESNESPKTGEIDCSNKGIPSDKEELTRKKKAKISNVDVRAAFKTSSILPPPLPCPRVQVSTELITAAFGLKTSRSGRLLVPPLAHWQGQRVMRNTDGGIVAISHGMENSLDSTIGFKPPSEAALKKLQEQLCTVATKCLNKNTDGGKKKPQGPCHTRK